MKKNLSKKISVLSIKVLRVLLIFSTVFFLFTPVTSVHAATNSRVVIVPMMDTNFNSVQIEVVEEEKAWRINKAWNGDSEKSIYCGGSYSPFGAAKLSCAYLNYPGLKYKEETGITAKDEALATNAVQILENSFAEVVSLIEKNRRSSNEFSINDLLEEMEEKLTEDENGSVVSHGDLLVSGLVISFKPLRETEDLQESSQPARYEISEGVNKGTTINNYAVVSVKNSQADSGISDYAVVQFSVPKGYSEGQYAEERWTASSDDWHNVSFISMYGIAKYANYAASKGYIVSDTAYTAIYGDDGNAVTGIFKWISNGILQVLYKVLGVTDIIQLVFNRGSRDVSYYYGIMPWKWMDVAKIFYWISLVASAFLMFYQIYLLVVRRSAADISPSLRADRKDTLFNIAVVFFLQIIYVPLFSLICQSNYLIVSLFSSLVSESATTFDIGINGIGYFIVSVASLALTVSMNIRYIIRSLTVALAYACGPVFICTIALDQKKHLFNTWLKEIVSTVFLQTFNALILAFLLMVTTNQRGLMRLIILYSFIPLNKWYRESLWNVKSGSDLAAEATEQRTNLRQKAAGAVTGALLGASMFDKSSGTDWKGKGIVPAGKPVSGMDENTQGEKQNFKEFGTSRQTGGSTDIKTAGSYINDAAAALNRIRQSADNPQLNWAARKAGAIGIGMAMGSSGLPGAHHVTMGVASGLGGGIGKSQDAYKKGYTDIRTGFLHRNEQGEIDGYAETKDELINRFAGQGGTMERGQIGFVDPNRMDPDTWNAMKVTGADRNAEGEQMMFIDPRSGQKIIAATEASEMMDLHKAGIAARSEMDKFRNAGYAGMKEEGWFCPYEDGSPGGTWVNSETYAALADHTGFERAYRSRLDSSFIGEGFDHDGHINLSDKGMALRTGINDKHMDPGSFMDVTEDGAYMISRADPDGSQNVPNANMIAGNILSEQRREAANHLRQMREYGYTGTSFSAYGRSDDHTGMFEVYDMNMFNALDSSERNRMKYQGYQPLVMKEIDPVIARNASDMALLKHALNDNEEMPGVRLVESGDKSYIVQSSPRSSLDVNLPEMITKETAKNTRLSEMGYSSSQKGMMKIRDNGSYDFKSVGGLSSMKEEERLSYTIPAVRNTVSTALSIDPLRMNALKESVNSRGRIPGAKVEEDGLGNAYVIQLADEQGNFLPVYLGSIIDEQLCFKK